MEVLIGDKNSFGIEIKIIERNHHGYYLGYSRLWFGGEFLGTIEDYIYINSYLLKGLQKCLIVPELDDSYFYSSEEKFHYFMNRDNDLNDNEVDKFKINFGTMSDSFTIRAYRSSRDLVVLWKFWRNDNNIDFTDLKNYGNEVHEHKMPLVDFSCYVAFLSKILSIPDLLESGNVGSDLN